MIGIRATRKAILSAMPTPHDELARLQKEGKGAQRLAVMERLKVMPFGEVWDSCCDQAGGHGRSGLDSGSGDVRKEYANEADLKFELLVAGRGRKTPARSGETGRSYLRWEAFHRDRRGDFCRIGQFCSHGRGGEWQE